MSNVARKEIIDHLEKYNAWHYPGAIRGGIGDISGIVDDQGKDKVYIVYCQKGLQSAYAASRIKSLGANAFYASEESMKKISGISSTGKS